MHSNHHARKTIIATHPDDRAPDLSRPFATDRDPLRVAVAHQSRMVTDGLSALLQATDHLEVISSSSGVPELDDVPDVLVLDPDLVDEDAFASLLCLHPEMKVLLIADATETERNIGLLAAGAAGLVDHTAGAEAVARAAFTVTHGLGVAPTRYIQIAAHRLDAAYVDHLDALDDDEIALWLNVADGLDYGSIGEQHFVAERTARRHVDALLEKLGVDNRLQAAELAGRIFLRDRQAAAPDDS